MLTFNIGSFEECLSSFLAGEYKDALFVVRDVVKVKELSENSQGIVNIRNSRITFEDGKCVNFFVHHQDKFVVSGYRYQYLALIDHGIDVDKLMYLLSRLKDKENK